MELQLTVLNGTLAGKTYDLNAGHLLIGRSPNCSVRFDPFAEKIVSSQHAFIESRRDGFYLRDNNSTNGTFLNGERISECPLANGDVIRFGTKGIEARVAISASTAESGAATEGSRIVGTSGSTPTVAVEGITGLPVPVDDYAGAAPGTPESLKSTFSGFGLSQPHAIAPPRQTGKYVAVGIMSFLIALFILPVILILATSLGPLAAVVAGFVAFFPLIFYISPLLWLDRYDPEPIWLLVLCFSWGAIVAVLASAIVNDIFTLVAAISTNSAELGQLAAAVISAPFIEETTKGLGLLALLIFFRRHFDDILDGIVLGGVIALGFATVENILYYGRGLLEEGFGGLAVLFLLRGILSPFAHVTFTAMTGIGCGLSRESHKAIVKFAAPVVGYVLAISLHAIWNGMSVVIMLVLEVAGLSVYCSSLGLAGTNIGLCAFLVGYIILEVPLFLIFIGFSIYVMRRQNRILKEMLAIDVARGLIKQEHLDISTSAFRSITWSLGGLLGGKFVSRRRYLRAVGKLGLSYWHIQRATAAQGHTGSFQQNPFLRAEVEKYGGQV